MTQVSAAMIRKDGKILICRRGAGGSCAFLWEFPGGKQEPGETPEQCAVRECMEELGIKIKISGIYDRTSYRYPEREIGFTFFEAEILDGEPQISVHSDMHWVLPTELKHYEFCPADVEIIERLQTYGD